ncbi:hypothetical protein UFOVP661_67 [uncultured Caudovirales phage]|uniref:Uncharacterized protein n=1 Tax=uncultured Caudovirales phage TaxID=2100421 RepID=A0A6J5ND49_9CAUD|nr:hypothetical protein UFOVP661_67 [uncultured Caudovirales phage]
MDPQALLNVAVGVVLAGMGWFGRQLWDAVKELRTDLHRLETSLPTTYLRRDEFRDGIKEIKELFTEVFRKIDDLKDRKVDK